MDLNRTLEWIADHEPKCGDPELIREVEDLFSLVDSHTDTTVLTPMFLRILNTQSQDIAHRLYLDVLLTHDVNPPPCW